MSRQDRQGVRTPAGLEQKYNFDKRFKDTLAAVERLDTNLNAEGVFNRLTENGKAEGVFMGENGDIYINASYLVTGILRSKDNSTFYLDLDNGILKGRFQEFSIAGKTVDDIAGDKVDSQSQEDIYNKLTNNGEAEGLYFVDGQLYINASYLVSGVLKSKDGSTFYLDLSNNTLKGDFTELSVGGEPVLTGLRMSMKKLWQNASATSSFAGQTITVDLSGYDLYMVTAVAALTSQYIISTIIPATHGGVISYTWGDSGAPVHRSFVRTANGVQFYGAYYNKSPSTDHVIPFQIYGIKGVG